MFWIGTYALLFFAGTTPTVTQLEQPSVGPKVCSTSPYAVQSEGETWVAYNPRQDWSIEFDGRAFQASPASKAWVWGLELERFGFLDQAIELTEPVGTVVRGNEMTYDWGGGLQEWYINDERGLEHGYTVAERPVTSAEDGPLVLELRVQGSWDSHISAAGTDVTFLSRTGTGAVDYHGLYAFDSNGRDLPARFRADGDRLEIIVDERGATYPITIDPVAQQLYIKASNSSEQDFFGYSVSISGDTMVMGAINEDSAATTINGLETDDSAQDAGAAYVFVRQGGAWVQQAYLKASNAESGDNFGYGVAISGDTIVVSAMSEASSATGVDGDESDNSAFGTGAAYVFVRNAGVWTQQAYLKASNSGVMDNFGYTVAASGDTVAVGAYFEQSNGTGINGNELDNSLFEAGAVYVFKRNGTTWSQEAYVKPLQMDSGDLFGWSMALHGDILVVGANKESGAATGVNGDDSDNSAPKSGAAYVFTRTASTWAQTAYLKASNTEPGDRFACGLDYSGGLIVVGATYEDSNTTVTDGDQSDNSVPSAGAAYVFDWNGTDWVQLAYLKPPLTGLRDHFGAKIAVDGDKIVIGAYDEDSSTTGINPDMSDDLYQTAGAAYVFEKEGATWQFKTSVKASNTSEFAAFAFSIDLQGSTLLVGAPGEDSSATGMNGDQGNGAAIGAGAAYLFTLDGPSPQVPFCFGDGSGASCPCGSSGAIGAGCPNSFSNGAILSSGGQAFTTADSLNFSIEDSAPGSPGLLLQGNMQFGAGGLAIGNGLLCSQSQKRWQTMVPDSAGSAVYGPNQFGTHLHAIPGATLFYQWWYRDPSDSCGGGFNFSNAVAVTWQ